ncbi:olfactory receptor 6N1-like [Ambystoma mexicanum]|uniref:olfactory receptor 6N1-like n=1 Tax=Ambystoma mexicanum TaxID=8296 RepID=UPI0037E8D33C
MEDGNETRVREFHLLGFSSFHRFQPLLFVIILFVYLITITGNVVIILVVRMETCLHSPMYLFISTLSVLEIAYISVTVPKLLTLLLGANPLVSFVGCFTQVYMFHSLGISECVLLGVMAFDRYLAICKPLHYTTIMTSQSCIQLASFAWVMGFLDALIPTIFTARLRFCASNQINHFFCDLAPLLNLACGDISFTAMVNTLVGGCSLIPLCLIVVFYVNIIWAILQIKTTEGRHKAFSTCSSHLIVAGLYYGSATIVYVIPKGSRSVENDKLIALMYAVFTPMLNPFIYSLRNKEVRHAINKHVNRLKMTRTTLK